MYDHLGDVWIEGADVGSAVGLSTGSAGDGVTGSMRFVRMVATGGGDTDVNTDDASIEDERMPLIVLSNGGEFGDCSEVDRSGEKFNRFAAGNPEVCTKVGSDVKVAVLATEASVDISCTSTSVGDVRGWDVCVESVKANVIDDGTDDAACSKVVGQAVVDVEVSVNAIEDGDANRAGVDETPRMGVDIFARSDRGSVVASGDGKVDVDVEGMGGDVSESVKVYWCVG